MDERKENGMDGAEQQESDKDAGHTGDGAGFSVGGVFIILVVAAFAIFLSIHWLKAHPGWTPFYLAAFILRLILKLFFGG